MARLLLDQNLSYRLVEALSDRFPGSCHVRDVGLARASDRAVWSYARDHDFTIVTKDGDFNQTAFLTGGPPKIVWLRIGNCTTEATLAVVRRHVAAIETFIGSMHEVVLIVGED